MQGIAELPSYARLASKLLDQQERQDLIAYLANNPETGDIMEGTGGVRKLRWSREAKAKAAACESSITSTTLACRCIC